MIRPDISIGVRRLATAPALGFRNPLEGQQRGWHRGHWTPNILEQGRRQVRAFDRRSRRRVPGPRVGVAGQGSLLKLLFWGDVREIAQILVQTDRTDHPDYFR